MEIEISNEEKSFLLLLARDTIACKLFPERKPMPHTQPGPGSLLNSECGAFVTLHKSQSLRGCIGNMTGRGPLIDTIKEMAVAAAFSDPRFPVLNPGEFEQVDIEISVLSQLQLISKDNIESIKIGKHGILLSGNGKSGVLLPQVATGYNWNREQFLEQTCLKSGLPGQAWKDDTVQIKIFSALIFSEH